MLQCSYFWLIRHKINPLRLTMLLVNSKPLFESLQENVNEILIKIQQFSFITSTLMISCNIAAISIMALMCQDIQFSSTSSIGIKLETKLLALLMQLMYICILVPVVSWCLSDVWSHYWFDSSVTECSLANLSDMMDTYVSFLDINGHKWQIHYL